MPKFIITGANGMLARAIQEHSYFNDNQAYDHTTLDICNEKQLDSIFSKEKTLYLINCAAYTDVTKAEQDYDNAYLINALGVKNLVSASNKYGFKLIHFSTDFVFKGDQKLSKQEEDKIEPVNCYGKSKAEGEFFIRENLNDYIIMRVSWLFGPYGKNFVSIISKLMQEKASLDIVSDQYGRTTYTPDVAEALKVLLDMNYRGIIHFANQGICSRYEFTKEIYRLIRERKSFECIISPIKGNDYPDLTPRPAYSVLNTDLFEQISKQKIKTWQEALREYLVSV